VSISVVLVDDQALIRTGFKMILEAEDDIEVIGEAGDGEQAISVAKSTRPDVVLMDVQMPTMDGLEATGRIVRETSIPSRILILTTFERDDYVLDALRAGASGFLLKNSPPEELVHAVRVIAAGDALLAPSVTRKVIEEFVHRPARRTNEVELQRLTERETEVLELLATGKSNSELACSLFVGEGTIKTHVSNVLTKLGLRDRMQAVIFAYESGLVEPGQHRE
jgi:DNA-binding NarL/FixJ family response regulator